MGEVILGLLLGSTALTTLFGGAAFFQAIKYDKAVSNSIIFIVVQIILLGYLSTILINEVEHDSRIICAASGISMFFLSLLVGKFRRAFLYMTYLLVLE